MNLLWAFKLSESIDLESGQVIPVDLNNFAKVESCVNAIDITDYGTTLGPDCWTQSVQM
jgi:hypothetical protein